MAVEVCPLAHRGWDQTSTSCPQGLIPAWHELQGAVKSSGGSRRAEPFVERKRTGQPSEGGSVDKDVALPVSPVALTAMTPKV